MKALIQLHIHSVISVFFALGVNYTLQASTLIIVMHYVHVVYVYAVCSLILNHCHFEYIKMPGPFQVASQSNYLIQAVDTNLHTE